MGNAVDLVSFAQLQHLIGAPARCTVSRWVREGTFPQPVKIGPRRIAWRRADVERWLASRQNVAETSTRDDGAAR